MYNATVPEMGFGLVCKSGSEFDPDVISEVCHHSFSCLDLGGGKKMKLSRYLKILQDFSFFLFFFKISVP